MVSPKADPLQLNAWLKFHGDESLDYLKRDAAVDLEGRDLRNADLGGSDLSYANMRGARMQKSDLRASRMKKADLKGTQLQGSDLESTELQGANLTRAVIQLTDMRGVDFRSYRQEEAGKWIEALAQNGLQENAVEPIRGKILERVCREADLSNANVSVLDNEILLRSSGLVAWMRILTHHFMLMPSTQGQTLCSCSTRYSTVSVGHQAR